MIEGSDDLDISSCDAMKPISGYDGKTFLHLVRNPNYRASTDSRARRTTPTASSSPWTPTSTTSTTRSGGELEDEYATASPKVFREYSTDSSKRKYLKSNRPIRPTTSR